MPAERERTHLTLFVPGAPASLDAWARALAPAGFALGGDALSGAGVAFSIGVAWEPNPGDGSFGEAFSFGTATDEEQRAIDAAPGALVLSFPVDLHRERAAIVSVVRALAACGAIAVRVEESKLGFPVAAWLERVGGEDPWSLYRSVVVLLGDEGEVATCGMHVFSLPDAHVALEPGLDAEAANALLGVLNVYQLVDDPVLVSGHTFSPDPDAPRRVLHRWPDAGYPPGHACHNPFGVWRLGPPGGKAEPARELAFVFMPPLLTLLAAAEEKEGRPLTRARVEELASSATGITMEHRDAQTTERDRGFADLDPERVWEQWQLARPAG